ncbi:MAG: hypothetical protein ABI986_07635 [Chloroflexota bacterium]
MDVNTFYAVTAATCFTLVGLWWSVVKDHPEWLKDEVTKHMAGGVYASFLIPALMSMGAQIGGEGSIIWNLVFIVAGVVGIRYTTRLIQKTKPAEANGPFSKNRWVLPLLYGIVIFFAIFTGLPRFIGLKPLQVEGLILCLLILIAHMLAWEFMSTPN